MLSSLRIQNIAIIELLEIDFFNGLNVLSGETGAGKSIIIDAVNLVLGERADREMIRTGSEKAVVEAEFITKSKRAYQVMDDLGLEREANITLSREIYANGKNICRINGTLVNTAALRKLGRCLADIHGQHEHQAIFDEETHLSLLDAFRPDAIEPLQQEYRCLFSDLQKIEKELQQLGAMDGQRERQMDILQFCISEIETENISEEEEEALRETREVMAHSEQIAYSLESANESFYGVGDQPGVLELISTAQNAIGKISGYSPDYQQAYERIAELYYLAEAVAEEIRNLHSNFYYDPGELEQTERRLSTIERLQRKYGGSTRAVLDYVTSAKEEWETLLHAEDRIKELTEKIQQQRVRLLGIGLKLHEIRQEIARRFEEKITGSLVHLGMQNARFCIAFEPINAEHPSFYPDGLDRVRFLFSANKGEDLRPLAKIASGGEASRIMLAIKSIFARIDEVGCLIFDEIDTGISGRIAQVVAEELAKIGADRQVLCVSHLAQLAAMADEEFYIEKDESQDRTSTAVRHLSQEERVQEIARLAGGQSGDIALAHAKEMLREAERIKQSFA